MSTERPRFGEDAVAEPADFSRAGIDIVVYHDDADRGCGGIGTENQWHDCVVRPTATVDLITNQEASGVQFRRYGDIYFGVAISGSLNPPQNVRDRAKIGYWFSLGGRRTRLPSMPPGLYGLTIHVRVREVEVIGEGSGPTLWRQRLAEATRSSSDRRPP